MQLIYAKQKELFEDNLRRCELKPVPGDWWLQNDASSNTITSRKGKCCALSPSLLGKPVTKSSSRMLAIVRLYGVDEDWVRGAIAGFDGTDKYSLEHEPGFSLWRDGYLWGQLMKTKYVIYNARVEQN